MSEPTGQLVVDFAKMGASLKIDTAPEDSWKFRARGPVLPYILDVRNETFELTVPEGDTPDLRVIDVQPDERHLVLMDFDARRKFLCGHDERHWFLSEVRPDGVRTVADAMEALKPTFIAIEEDRRKMSTKDRKARKNIVRVRQGEWFFSSVPDMIPESHEIRKNEPLQRAGGTPHIAQEAVRRGGHVRYVCDQRPHGVSQTRYDALLKADGKARFWNWRQGRVNASVYVRGTVRHADHNTVKLQGWHLVEMAQEVQWLMGFSSVQFID